MKPTPYGLDEYVRWHDTAVTADQPILARLETLRTDIMVAAMPDLDFLYQLLTYMFIYSRNEYKRARGQEANYQTPLSEALPIGPSGALSPRYFDLFKTVPSIVNKMWRKADDEPRVTLSNILQSITDLIRTDVRTETLDGAQFLAHRMNDLPGLLYNEELRAQYEGRVTSISFEPEMKSEWRKLSHQRYEQVRLEPIAKHEFASPEARLISLGHALHLAECEIMRLRQEIEKK
jgi:hypothetical protein